MEIILTTLTIIGIILGINVICILGELTLLNFFRKKNK